MRKQKVKYTGIRARLIIYFLIFASLFSLLSFLSYYNARVILHRTEPLVVDYVKIEELNSEINQLMVQLEQYLLTKSSDALLNYYKSYNRLEEQIKNINKELSFNQENLMLKDISNLTTNLLIETEQAIQIKRGKVSSLYTANFIRAGEINEEITYFTNQLLSYKLTSEAKEITKTAEQMKFYNFLNLLLILFILLISAVLSFVLTERLTRPISKLAEQAKQISAGNFQIEPLNLTVDDEVKTLADAFRLMVKSIRSYIEEIKKKAEMERNLQEQQIENLQMKGLLKEAELKMLQSQINPHFLYNTLNAAVHLAEIEGAEKTAQLIINTANLFRYNLRQANQEVTIFAEIQHVENYLSILQTRFGEKISYQIEIEPELPSCKMPGAVIQPIVENAYIHGLEELERFGLIKIKVYQKENKDKGIKELFIEVMDNGKGMTEEKIEEIMQDGGAVIQEKQHISRIGLNNVISRLKLYYNINRTIDLLEIESKPDQGTTVRLKLPLSEGVANYEAVNSR